MSFIFIVGQLFCWRTFFPQGYQPPFEIMLLFFFFFYKKAEFLAFQDVESRVGTFVVGRRIAFCFSETTLSQLIFHFKQLKGFDQMILLILIEQSLLQGT